RNRLRRRPPTPARRHRRSRPHHLRRRRRAHRLATVPSLVGGRGPQGRTRPPRGVRPYHRARPQPETPTRRLARRAFLAHRRTDALDHGPPPALGRVGAGAAGAAAVGAHRDPAAGDRLQGMDRSAVRRVLWGAADPETRDPDRPPRRAAGGATRTDASALPRRADTRDGPGPVW